MRRLAIILALLVALDATTTLYALTLNSNSFVEIGLFASKLLPILGPLYFVFEYFLLLLLAVLAGRAPLGAKIISILPAVVVAVAVVNNLYWLLIGG